MVLSLCLASFWIAVSLQVVGYARMKCAVSVLGYALVEWFYRGSWLRSERLVLSDCMATLFELGSLTTSGYALAVWFTLHDWLRSAKLVPSRFMATLSQTGSVVTDGYAR